MRVAITFCHETEHERRKDKGHNSFFGRSEAESLPRLIQFGVPLQFLACSFCRNRTIPLTHRGGSRPGAASSKTLVISKSGEFTVFGATGQNTACDRAAF
jgi:hypothetical protein